jgi:hypothetical protein
LKEALAIGHVEINEGTSTGLNHFQMEKPESYSPVDGQLIES